MRKFIILVLLMVPFIGDAKETYYNQRIDSITYQYYLAGDWNTLIDSAKQAIKENVDFKYLRQRLGYAYFIKEDYYASQKQYEKELAFDKADTITRTYLYYCGLNTDNEVYSRFRGGQLPTNIKKTLGIKPFRIINSLNVEYSYKINNSSNRGNPSYLRGGIDSKLGYRLNLYQSGSTFKQNNDSNSIKQNDYFALLNWAVSPHISLDIGYHYLSTRLIETSSYQDYHHQMKTVIDTLSMPGNLFYSKLTAMVNRFDFAISWSIMNYDSVLTQQYGIHSGVLLPGKLNVYLKSSIYAMLDDSTNNCRFIFKQSASALVLKKLWLEANVTLGNLNNFSDNKGLYIYNSIDQTTFRTGITFYWYLFQKISLFGNYSFDKKLIEDKNTHYNQHSFSSGIIWKL